MKNLKLLFITLLFALTGCGKTAAVQTQVNADIPVESIVTTMPVISLREDEACILHYSILPYNATDKSIAIDTTSLRGIGTIRIDPSNNILFLASSAGTGIVSLVTTNNKFVSYSITVTAADPIDPIEPVIKTPEDVANYFNTYSTCGQIEYYGEFDYWFLHCNFGNVPGVSEQILLTATNAIRDFLPLKGVVEDGYLTNHGGPVFSSIGHLLTLDVSPNWSAIVFIISYVEDSILYADIYICDNLNTIREYL